MKRFRKLLCMMISLALLTGCTPAVSILEIQKPEADLTEKTLYSDTIYYVVAEVPESWEEKGDFLVAPSTGSSGEATISVIQWNTPALQETYQEQVDLLFQHDYEAFEDVFNNLYSGDGVLQKIQAYRYEEQEIFEVQYLDTEQDENIILYRKDIPYCIMVPCVIRDDVDDTGAARIMLDTNLEQRPQPKYSELAYAYRMQTELSKKQGHRSDLDTSSNGCTKLDTAGSIGKKDGKSRSTVHNYIRLSYLIPGLLNAVDDKVIEMMAGVELSYITEEYQKQILAILPEYGKMKKKTANDLRKAFEENGLTEENIREYLAPKPKKEKPVQFTVSMKRLAPYRDILPNQETLESLFIEFLDQLKSSMQQVP